ncbi:hypothetical protein [Bacillus sp. FJAT-27225]|uniref:hypothetical protein n=1 Tax=Bacillus sp. FJAT-27225 TaxID=1743144 RepID=UPI0009822718|nr:hypothetical protein [Bacillus sp. FJAT-27225]
MVWKMRIPLFIFVLGTLSGIVQMFPNILLANTTYFIRSVVFIGILTILFMLFEKTKINEMNVHISEGLALIGLGFLIDFIMV